MTALMLSMWRAGGGRMLAGICLGVLILGRAAAAEEAAADAPSPTAILLREKLTGDWFGIRTAQAEHGVAWDISATTFYQGIASGGTSRRFDFGGRGDVLLALDGQKMGLWQGLFVNLHAETLYGTATNGRTGALMPVSVGQLLPGDAPVTALTGVKLTQFLSEQLAVYFGKLNTLDDFNQPFTGGAAGLKGFMNTAFLLPPILARTIPYSTYGAGVAVLRDLQPVFTLTVFDPSNTPTVSGFDTFFDRGVVINAQATLPTTKLRGLPGHYSVGGVYSNAQYAALNDLAFILVQRLRGQLPALPRQTGSWAVYGLFDQALNVDPCDPKRSWGLFGSLGITDGNPNPLRWSGAIGLGGASPLRHRPLDSFGVGYYYVGVSEALKNTAPRVLPLRDEQGVELFYNVGVTPWCHITPDLQVVTPVRARVEASVVFGLRARVDF
jgi:porin